MDPLELIDLGNQVVLLATVPTRGQSTGVQLRHRSASVFDLNDGLVARHREYFDHTEALEAVGLRE